MENFSKFWRLGSLIFISVQRFKAFLQAINKVKTNIKIIRFDIKYLITPLKFYIA